MFKLGLVKQKFNKQFDLTFFNFFQQFVRDVLERRVLFFLVDWAERIINTKKKKTQIRPQVRWMLSRPARRGAGGFKRFTFTERSSGVGEWNFSPWPVRNSHVAAFLFLFFSSLFYFQKIYSHFTNPLENVLKFYLNELIDRSLICDFLKILTRLNKINVQLI